MAARLARIALGHVTKEYPHKLDHVLGGDEDALPPRALHPVFYGSFDWHSCVHGWWTLLTLRRLFPEMPEAEEIRRLADDSFSQAKIAIETGLSGPSVVERIRAAVRLGVAARASSRSNAPSRSTMGDKPQTSAPAPSPRGFGII